jgi:hypothetical protein
MTNSAVQPGQIITAAKLNNITTGTSAPAASGSYPVGDIWVEPTSGPRVFTSPSAWSSLGSIINPPPRAFLISNTSLTYNSEGDYLTTSVVWTQGITSSSVFGGFITYRVDPTTTSYRSRFELRANSQTGTLLSSTSYVTTYQNAPARHYVIEWIVGPVFSTSGGSRRVGWCRMFQVDDNMAAGSSSTTSAYVTLSTQTATFTSAWLILPPATLTSGTLAKVVYWVI